MKLKKMLFMHICLPLEVRHVVVVYHVTIVAIGHGLLKKIWPMVIGCFLRTAGSSMETYRFRRVSNNIECFWKLCYRFLGSFFKKFICVFSLFFFIFYVPFYNKLPRHFPIQVYILKLIKNACSKNIPQKISYLFQ